MNLLERGTGLAIFFSVVAMLTALPAAAALPDAVAGLGREGLLGLGALLGAALAGLIAVPALVWQRRRAARQADKAADLAEAATRLEEVLSVAPDGFYLWTADGGERCSRRLAVVLGLYGGVEAGYADVLESFGISEAAVLEVAVAALRQHGTAFELELELRGGNRRMRVMGARAAAEDGQPLAEVMWMRDVTEDSVAVDRLASESADLGAERDRLRTLLDGLPMPVWLRDDDLALLYCNEAYARAADAESPEQAVEEGLELVPGPSVREARALAARARAAGTARSGSFHLVVGGSRRLLELTEVPLAAGPTGSGLLTAGFALDQTPLEEARSEVARHVSAHAEVLENLGTAIAIFSSDNRLAFHNTAFRRLWRLEEEWLNQQPGYGSLLDVLRERRRLPEVVDYRAYRGEEMRRFTSLIDPIEDLLHLPDETTLRRVISPHPFGGLLFTYEDVTDALALERSFNTLIAVQRETLDNLHEGVAVFGGDGRLRLFNPAYARMWRLSPEELADEPHVADLVERQRDLFADGPEWPAIHDRLLELFQQRAADHGRIERADGSILDYASVPLPDGAVLTTWLDVSDSARVERALRERNEALRAADRLKSEFIANVSCEVRQPLTTIIGFSEILSHEYYGKLNRRQADYSRGITQAGQALETLISDILDLATIEAGQMTLQLAAFDVHAMLAGVLALMRERVREKGVKLHFDCPLDIGWMVADERRIKQVLFNLLSNAVKFTPQQGAITLAAQRQGGEIVLTVADTGVGIPEPELTGVFDRFRRGSHPDARQGGAGLGLSLVRSFVELHGGRVEIVSVQGEGTTVTCNLPAGAADVTNAS